MSVPNPFKLLPALVLIAGGAQAAKPYSIKPVEHAAVAMVERYELQVPASENVAYSGAFKSAFPAGFPYAPGSGLAFRKVDKDGSLIFWGVGDRGPNGDAPKVRAADKSSIAKVFPSPDYAPRLAEIRVQLADRVSVVRSLPLLIDGEKASGLPLTPGSTGATGEVALSDTLGMLGYNARGIDPEGLALDKAGNLWLVDEYGPFLAYVETATGKVSKKLAPGAGLPDILRYRQPNRGFEGVAVTPNGKVYAMVQSTLDVNGETRNLARFTRIVELDPASGATRQFAYPIDADVYKKTGDAKLGDIVAIDDTHLLLIEQGKGADKKLRNVLYVIDIAGADDISERKTADGKALEYAKADELAAVKLIRKQRVLDLRELGWQPEKSEGLALFEGGIAVINDNDFGLKASVEGGSEKDPEDNTVEGSKLIGGGNYVLKASQEPTELWLLHLKQPLKAYFPK
ncbi:hypothetical protein IGB42_01256 [Andreprevotia sp. IGB-42]|uniref:esterase-like activity of phytase family protein n=1 Tax=Andreprevotia sp. IGB-42 TaxID=2497473 RepID=UPI00135954DC|nr:esterase-like activity of phytase family protein [Andreprevotia sp. IGB-42]KAF0814355.1 hypothetical protein IGB42_01256 [Andreprevotia sp. IGB-42]